MKQVLKSISTMVALLEDPRVTLRFHSLKRTKEGMQIRQPVPWLWTVSNRVSAELWFEIAKLSHHASWQLIQVRVKQQTLSRQPLAEQIQKLL